MKRNIEYSMWRDEIEKERTRSVSEGDDVNSLADASGSLNIRN